MRETNALICAAIAILIYGIVIVEFKLNRIIKILGRE